MLGTEIKTNNCKRLATAVAIFAILVCCLAVAVPSMSDGVPDQSEATVTNYADLNTALGNSSVDTIFINGTIGSATNYITIDVERAVTINLLRTPPPQSTEQSTFMLTALPSMD